MPDGTRKYTEHEVNDLKLEAARIAFDADRNRILIRLMLDSNIDPRQLERFQRIVKGYHSPNGPGEEHYRSPEETQK